MTLGCLVASFANPYGIGLHQRIASHLFPASGVTGYDFVTRRDILGEHDFLARQSGHGLPVWSGS